jgi:hypothetical protein
MMARSGLLAIRRFIVPPSVIHPTLEVLAESGRQGYESFVVWGGTREEDEETFVFRSAYKPRQRSYKTERGLFVHVDEEALDRVNRAFNDEGLILAGQAHAHPTEAYHSDTDDVLPLVTLLGGLSVVVPDFAEGGLKDSDRFTWFRLRDYADWAPVDRETEIVIG